jgi:hypothetical protein
MVFPIPVEFNPHRETGNDWYGQAASADRALWHRSLATVHSRTLAGAAKRPLPILVVDYTYVIGYLFRELE